MPRELRASGLGPRASGLINISQRQRASESVSVSVSVFEFVFEGGSGLAVFRLAWGESVGNQGVESARPAE